MKRISIVTLLASSLFAQTGNPVADQAISGITSLAAQLAQANTKLASLSGWSKIESAVPGLQAVLLNAIGTQTNLVPNQLCCGPTTVPPTPPSLPPGYILIVIGPVPSAIITTGTPH